MFVFENRASAILYNFLRSNSFKKVFLLPVNVCPIVPLTFLKAGVPYEFVDISNEDYCLNKDSILKYLKAFPEKFSGILYVRTYGHLSEAQAFFKSVKSINKNFCVIDDRCSCKPDLNFPNFDDSIDLMIFSSGYGKYVDIGFGGFGYINSKMEYKRQKLPFCRDDYIRLENRYKHAILNRNQIVYQDTNWLDCRCPSILEKEYVDRIQNFNTAVSQRKEHLNRLYQEKLPYSIQLDKSDSSGKCRDGFVNKI